MTSLTYTDGVPAVDHHSHAGYVRPGQRIAGLDAYERENALGHVEGNVHHDDYQRYMALEESGKDEEAQALAESIGVPALVAASLRFQSTTVHARALRDGARALYGDHPEAELVEMSRQARADDFPGLYDRALHLSGTAGVLTDIPEIDSEAWPHRRYKPIARIDPYLYPFGHPRWQGRGSDTPRFRRIFSHVLDRQLERAGIALPGTLGEYEDFVLSSLRRRRSEGFVGLKIASAYVRPLSFQRVGRAEAEAAWAALAGGPREVPEAAHRVLSDHLVFAILEWATAEGMPVQIHTGFGHAEPGLRVATADPLLLEPLLADPALNRLKVILIHGGFPYSSHLTALAHAYGNVHLDFSWMPYLHHHVVGRVLEEWLEFLPADRVMYGTDTGSPELHVSATERARAALDGVLAEGVGSRLWSTSQACWLAERVLHRNLCDVYEVGL
ncbi:amidohydrolase family protein [Bogoriella caseilytica]|uniref:Amidohydrolase family protein n=1 Tax=Bogoriella caseilytica TaxID=56055 RepID=A0A3N2BE91_9MICO|nr:amidohydrolase family protein [Bogoriella caseilytica]ROR73576.1 amidohydrolase family protein [Bogoriella caseilytica]